MFGSINFSFLALVVLGASSQVYGREQWLEGRDGLGIALHPRRFGQENPSVISRLSTACPGQICGTLSGQAIGFLLAGSPECGQQDHADAIIDAAKNNDFDAATQDLLIDIAREYRQAEKNTPPDFTTNPPTPRNSVFCQRAPRNAELNGLVQAQDPANGDVFFDPATRSSVLRGDQPNTAPFSG